MDLGQRRHTLEHLEDAVLAQRAHAFAEGSLLQLLGAGAGLDHATEVLGHCEQFVQPGAPLVAGVATGRTAGAAELHQPALLAVILDPLCHHGELGGA